MPANLLGTKPLRGLLNALSSPDIGVRMTSKFISVRGAREHNLKNITVELPREKLVVITGLSGSGKSSLAFDTIYAEGQRRYVESLSAYARQFLDMMQKPDVDHIDGLSPAISIEQKTTSRNPRSTVGTVTEIYDYMRLLWARVGIPYSPATGLPIESQTVSQMVDRVLALPEGTRLYLLAPIARGRKGEYRKDFAELQKKGFQRVKVDGKFYEIAEVPALDKQVKHDIDVVVDRVVVRPDASARLADSFETALALSDGIAIAEFADRAAPTDASSPGLTGRTGQTHAEQVALDARIKTGMGADQERIIFSAKFACPVSGFTIEEIEPRLFSFNNPYGACPECDGLGTELFFEPEMIVPDESLSLARGAIAPWARTSATSPYYQQTLEALARAYRQPMTRPWKDLPKEFRDVILYGSGEDEITFTYDDGVRRYSTSKPFEGVINNIERRWRETESAWVTEELSRYQSDQFCEACKGYRLRPQALAVKIDGFHIGQVTEMSIRQAASWFEALPTKLTAKQNEIAARILKEIRERLAFLNDVGLDYLTLARASGTLSGGESQRIRLASQIGSGLTGVLYVLDEPSIGLHQRDNARLLDTLKSLRDMGNSVLVVEHDEEAILTADHVVDMGPGAGVHGGEVVAEGTPDEVMANPASLTGQYLTGFKQIPRAQGAAQAHTRPQAHGQGRARQQPQEHHRRHSARPVHHGDRRLGRRQVHLPHRDALPRRRPQALRRPRDPGRAQGDRGLRASRQGDRHRPVARSAARPRSNPATYTGAFTPIREWFAELPEAKTRGYKPGRFSFNVKGGRCEACQGDGVIKIEMHFLPDIYVTCDVCKGKRYDRETLEIKFKGKSIADVLDMTVEEAAELFKAVPAVRDKLLTLARVGLGYIHVGQQATTLSGGEAQRIKLSKELSKRATGRTLYILDEPTTGLHFHDVAKLLEVLHELVDQGNTVVVIEHNLEVIKTADWIVDMGPEGGDAGGEVVAVGTPEEIAAFRRAIPANI